MIADRFVGDKEDEEEEEDEDEEEEEDEGGGEVIDDRYIASVKDTKLFL